jgi:CheY-like chemotaxis protein/anti-sigma regulatory factor (Ser/Thr protein kinase)
MAFVKQMAQKKGIHVAYRQSSSDLVMLADMRRLKQVLVNLLSNAVKFTEAGGQVSLEVQTNSVAQTILFAVQDTGIGISRAAQAELFQPFAQLDTGLARRQEGTGLGLALVRNLVDLHGGTVSVESDGVPGHGSRFLVTLPWHQPERRLAATPVVDSLPAPRTGTWATEDTTSPLLPAVSVREKPIILLAEDNEISLDAFDAFLTSAGYTVVAARTGVEALARAAEANPTLILMDVQMPEMDGLEAIRRLRAEPRFSHTPIIALTALAMTGDRERCLAAGADDYLSKPVGLRELVVRIEQVRARRAEGKV